MRWLNLDARALAGATAGLGLALAGAGRAQDAAGPPAAAPAPPPAAAATPPVPAEAPPAAPEALTEAVVAHVNDDVITNYDVIQRMRLLVATAGIRPTRDDLPELQRYALDSLVDERLELQELKREEKEQKFKIIANDDVVDDLIGDMAKQGHMTNQQLLASLAQAGIAPETLRAELRAQSSWQDWIRGRYGSRLRIGDDQIKAFQERVAAEADKPKYLISEVFVDATRAGGIDAAVNEANQLVSQLHQGAQFAQVARQFSAASTAANGGDAGWVTAGELDPQVREVVDQLRPGALSTPIQVKDGVYIIYLRQRQAGGSEVLISLRQAAIALPADAPADQVDAARAKLEALRAELHGCENFIDTANKTPGVLAGDLGEAEAKDLAPAFRDAAVGLPVGAISEPIRSEQGLHILAVCGKRSNGAQGLTHDQIENRLMGEQLEMINRREIRDLRNSASIEVREAQAGS